MPPKKREKIPNRRSVVGSNHFASAATSATAAVTVPSSTPKKRKAEEENANIMKYAQQIQQKELEKKRLSQQHTSIVPTITTSSRRATANQVGTTTKRTSKSMPHTTVSSTSRRRAVAGRKSVSKDVKEAPEEEDDDEDDDDEEEEAEEEEEEETIQLPPSSKRQRIVYSDAGKTFTVVPTVAAATTLAITTSSTTVTGTNATERASYPHRNDPDHDRAKLWYEEKMAKNRNINSNSGSSNSVKQQRPTNAFGTIGSVQQPQQVVPADDIPSTLKPPPQQQLQHYSNTNASHTVSFASSTMTSRNTQVLTPPRNNIATGGGGGNNPYSRSHQAATSHIVDQPPSTQQLQQQMLRHRTSTGGSLKSSFPRRASLEKAPFGSPIPTLSSTLPHPKSSNNTTGVSLVQSPLLSMPSADELNSHHEPTMLSPNYNRKNFDHRVDDTTTDTTHLQPPYRPTSGQVTEYTSEMDHRRGDEPNIANAGNKDAWMASMAFVCVLLLSFLVALVMEPAAVLPESTISYFMSRIMNSELSTTATLKQTPCFMDHPIRNNVEIEEEIALLGNNRACDDQTQQQPCPHGGHCMDGKLKLCYDSYLQVAPDGGSCVFTDQAQRDFDAIVDLLTKYTVQHICIGPKRAKNPFYVQESSLLALNEDNDVDVNRRAPMFDYRSISDVLLLQYSPKLMLHATSKNSNTEKANASSGVLNDKILIERNELDGSILIGLHPTQNVPLPFDCYVTKITFSMLKTFMVWIGTVSVWIISRILLCYMEYPIALIGLTVTVSLTAIVLQKRDKARRAQIQFTNEVVGFRERVYDELMKDQNTSIPARIICDRIAWNMYPRSSQKRRRIHDIIFPCVSRDLETDSRIIVSWRAATSTTSAELHWQWNDTQPHTSTTKLRQTQAS